MFHAICLRLKHIVNKDVRYVNIVNVMLFTKTSNVGKSVIFVFVLSITNDYLQDRNRFLVTSVYHHCRLFFTIEFFSKCRRISIMPILASEALLRETIAAIEWSFINSSVLWWTGFHSRSHFFFDCCSLLISDQYQI